MFKESKEHFCGSFKFSNQNLRQIGQEAHKL